MAVEVKDLAFSYGQRRVFDGLSLTLTPGSTVVLGPNGAGKSTLLRILASVQKPRDGVVLLDGTLNPSKLAHRRSYRKLVSWLPQGSAIFPGLTTRQHVAYAGWLKGMSRADAWAGSISALEMVGLLSRADEPTKRLSGGQVRRMSIAGALVHNARVILLDEPTAGLDPAQRIRFRSILSTVSTDRVVVVSSHDTDDAHESFDQVAVLAKGELTFHGSMSEFVASSPRNLDDRDRVQNAYMRFAGVEE